MGQGRFPARQLNICTSKLPGVDRNETAENKRPVLVEGRLYARPLFNITSGSQRWEMNPNIYNGRLVTPLGIDLGGEGETNDIALYDNAIFNLEPNVNQDYVHVNTYKYEHAMPDAAPASRVIDSGTY